MRDIDCVTHHRESALPVASHFTRYHFAEMQTDPTCALRQRLLQGPRATPGVVANGTLARLATHFEHSERRHHRITDETIDDAAVLEYYPLADCIKSFDCI